MNREGLSKVKRAEYLARLEALERMIKAHEMRVDLYRSRGWEAKDAEQHLKLLRHSYELHCSVLEHLLQDEPAPSQSWSSIEGRTLQGKYLRLREQLRAIDPSSTKRLGKV